MKIVDTEELVSMLRGLTEEGHEVSMQITGNSMSPFLQNGRDKICFRKPEKPLKKGDMVFFQRETGQYVMHRICKKKQEGFYLVGDGQIQTEGPVRPEQIFAVITKVQRKGKWIGPGSFWWEFFAHIWLRVIPLRRMMMSCYGKVKMLWTKNKDQNLWKMDLESPDSKVEK